MAELLVLEPGVQTTVQDLGRPGFGDLGVTASGAFDRGAHERGARLLGNPDDSASLEILVGGLVATATTAVRAVLTGGLAPATVRGRPIEHGEPFFLLRGDRLRVGFCARGLRVYLSVAGGIAVDQTLGSRSADTLAGLGPSPLKAGDRIPLGAAPLPTRVVLPPTPVPASGTVTLDVLPGPRSDWLRGTLDGEWQVSQDSNRVGVRLDGPQLARMPGELPSEGVSAGAIQLPPHGRPVIFGPDHPTTGGYPVVGVLTTASLDALAQVQPGQTVRLRSVQATR